ncbi:hypothetical protein NDU88_007092 [Pleurodeles waltl]|uniref:Uncharacterized protein n=1 Tax=Pleurodeles waltl TaxID=8319 RepID=A0AAV7LR26_PLEWA|nr:hypothetical protein NDU88_007092 [Pleurodeles waltl]
MGPPHTLEETVQQPITDFLNPTLQGIHVASSGAQEDQQPPGNVGCSVSWIAELDLGHRQHHSIPKPTDGGSEDDHWLHSPGRGALSDKENQRDQMAVAQSRTLLAVL